VSSPVTGGLRWIIDAVTAAVRYSILDVSDCLAPLLPGLALLLSTVRVALLIRGAIFLAGVP
jgi:hypothetical protein